MQHTVFYDENNGFADTVAEEKEPFLGVSLKPIDIERQLQERGNIIRNVQASIFQVNDIYRELGVLVGSQHTCIDHIEANVEATAQLTSAARERLQQAARRPYRTRKCCFGLVPFLIAVIIVLLIMIIALA